MPSINELIAGRPWSWWEGPLGIANDITGGIPARVFGIRGYSLSGNSVRVRIYNGLTTVGPDIAHAVGNERNHRDLLFWPAGLLFDVGLSVNVETILGGSHRGMVFYTEEP